MQALVYRGLCHDLPAVHQRCQASAAASKPLVAVFACRCPPGSVDGLVLIASKNRPPPASCGYLTCHRIFIAKKTLKWLLPRHFRRQEARRCTRRYSSRVCEARCLNVTHRRRSSVEDQRGYLTLRARGASRGRKRPARTLGSLQLLRRALDYPTHHYTHVAQPDVGQKPSLTAGANTTPTPTDETTPTPTAKPMTRAGPREAPGDARQPPRTTPWSSTRAPTRNGLQGQVRRRQGLRPRDLREDEDAGQRVRRRAHHDLRDETYAYVGDKFVSTKDYTYETYDSAKTYTYDATLSLVENAQPWPDEDDARDGQPQGGARARSRRRPVMAPSGVFFLPVRCFTSGNDASRSVAAASGGVGAWARPLPSNIGGGRGPRRVRMTGAATQRRAQSRFGVVVVVVVLVENPAGTFARSRSCYGAILVGGEIES